MRFINYIFIALVLLMAGCSDNDTEYIFDKSVNERFEELKTNYTNTLAAPENGWIAYYHPNGKAGGFAVLFDFDKEGNVQMKSDYLQGANDDKITYRIDKTLKVELVFESHTVLHQIYETNDNDSGGEFVFNITSVEDEKVVLTSKTDNGYNGEEITEITLVPATKDQWDMKPIYTMTPKIANGYQSDLYFRVIRVEGTDTQMGFSYIEGHNKKEINRVARISYLDGEKVSSTDVPVAITPAGFKFLKPFTINGKEVTDFTYDETKNIFVSEDGGQKTIVEHSNTPGVVYYPAVASLGGNGKYLSTMYRHSYWFLDILRNSSSDFKALFNKSKISRFFIDYNEVLDDGTKLEANIYFEHKVFGLKSVAVKVERIKNKKIIFKPLEDPAKELGFLYALTKDLYNVFTAPEGFYVEESSVGTLYGTFSAAKLISVKDPKAYRFVTMFVP
ncbi:DUF4302 domain-containing protein [Prolixibacteraceae bacterium JC049]|nr:DUF4302 domain-containing protein [Prolixibacteraceae bacterium JC049]